MIILKALILLFCVIFIFASFTIITFAGYSLSAVSSEIISSPYLEFAPPVSLGETPHEGQPFDNSLVGYWSMNEGLGSLALDYSGNGNNGSLTGASWDNGRFGSAVVFNGSSNFVQVNDSLSLRTGDEWTRSLWVYSNIPAFGDGNLHEIWIQRTLSNKFLFRVNTAGGWDVYYSSSEGFTNLAIPRFTQQWVMVTVVKTGSNLTVYENGNSVASANDAVNEASDNSMIIFGATDSQSNGWFNGLIDEASIYTRALSSGEILALSTIGPYAKPNQAYFANYHNYTDVLLEKNFLICINNFNDTNTKVVCTNFFVDNRLIFKASNSAVVNIWTNLGQPMLINGVWNSQNYTTTITLDNSSTAELLWITGSVPSASKMHSSSTMGGSATVFSTLWTDNQSLSGGGFIFSTNNTGNWVNASWVPFGSALGWGNVTLELNSTIGIGVGFREYANNSLNLWGASQIYATKTVGNAVAPTPTPAQTISPTLSPSPTAKPSSGSGTNWLSTENFILIIALIIAVTVLAFAMKKGYLTVKVVYKSSDANS